MNPTGQIIYLLPSFVCRSLAAIASVMLGITSTLAIGAMIYLIAWGLTQKLSFNALAKIA